METLKITRFIWNIRTGADKLTPFHTSVNGRKNKAIVSVDEFTEGGDEPSIHKKSRISDMLHRLNSDKDRRMPFHTFSIGFDEAKAFRKATGSYLRENQWNDLTVDVYLEY